MWIRLVEADEVEIAFDQDDRVFLGDFGLGVGKSVKDFAFLVECGVRAVQVFGSFLFLVENASAERDDFSREIFDGEHQAVAELVGDAAVFPFDGETYFDEPFGRKAFFAA